MRFSSLEHTHVKTHKIKQFNGGINLSDLPRNVADNQLTAANNVWFSDGILKTRPGLSSSQDSVVTCSQSANGIIKTFSMSGTKLFIDGTYKTIAVEQSSDWDSNVNCIIYLTDEHANVSNTGYINFARTSESSFYEPINMLFFAASPTSGAGVYAFITTCDRYDTTNKGYHIYELNEARNNWTEVTSFYTPVVYVNGRGSLYEEAKATNNAYTASPMSVETPNLLNGSFRAYYTSDSYSSCFRLPYGNIPDSSGLTCRIYSSPGIYTEWVLYANQNYCTLDYFASEVTLRLDRENGVIDFSVSGQSFVVPMMSMYHENNIIVTTVKTTDIGFNDIVSCKCCTVCGDNLLFSGGNKLGKVFCVSQSNPLFFPLDAVFQTGSSDENITTLLTDSDRVLAFKKDEIYSLNISKGKALCTHALLCDNEKLFRKSDSISVKLINNKIGCSVKETAGIFAGKPIWLSSDNNICTLKNQSVTELSESVKPFLKELGAQTLETAFALYTNKNYMLITAKNILIMEMCGSGNKTDTVGSQGSVRWYIWSFDDELNIIGGTENSGDISLMCQNGNLCYMAELKDGGDTIISKSDTDIQIQTRCIPASVTTKNFDFENFSSKKVLDSIFLSVSSEDMLKFEICDCYSQSVRFDSSTNTNGEVKSVRIMPSVPPLRSAYLKLSSNNGLKLSDMIIYYREAE